MSKYIPDEVYNALKLITRLTFQNLKKYIFKLNKMYLKMN